MKVEITEVYPDSFWKNEIKEIVGMVVTVDEKIEKRFYREYCLVIPKESYFKRHGIWCKYIEVPEPSAMSELGEWIDEEKEGFRCNCSMLKEQAPKKLTWIQKIRGYDKLESMLSEALRDRDLHARTADNWQQKVIDANSETQKVITDYAKFLDLMENELLADTIGKRLKFSVGHNHIEIVVGNPVTYAKNVSSDGKKIEWMISRCSHKDTYDWKLGVRMALDNLCDDRKYSDKLRRDLRKALAKKYPEVFTK